MANEKGKKPRKIIFNEEIDSNIDGFALCITLIIIGLFLTFRSEYLGSEKFSTIIRWIFIIFGSLGLVVEMGKFKNKEIKGFDNLLVGLILLGAWIVCFMLWNIWYINVLALFFLILGLFGFFRGLIQIVYSFILARKGKSKGAVATNILLLLTEIMGMALVVVQIIQVLNT